MAVSQSNMSSTLSATPITAYTLSFTVPNVPDRILIVRMIRPASASQIDYTTTGPPDLRPKYGSQLLTQLGIVTNDLVDGSVNRTGVVVEVLYLLNPAVGTNNIEINMTIATEGVLQASVVRNAKLSAPFGTIFTAVNGPTPPATDVTNVVTGTGSAENLVIDAIGYEAISPVDPSPGGGQTPRFSDHLVSIGVVDLWAEGSDEPSNGGSVTMDWSSSADGAWASLAFEVIAGGARLRTLMGYGL